MDFALRIADPSDAGELLKIYAPYVLNTAITFEYDVPSAEEFSDRIVNTLARYPYIVVQGGGEILGYAYTGVFHQRAAYDYTAETSIYLRTDAHRRGLGRALYEALESISRAQNITNLYACIASPAKEDAHLDRNSEEFHAHMGYEYAGRFHSCGYKFGAWYDMVYMEKRIAAPSCPQPAFIPFPQLSPEALRAAGTALNR